MLIREQLSFDMKDPSPRIRWRDRVVDAFRALHGLLINPLHVGLPQHDRRLELVLATQLAVMLYVSAFALMIHFVLSHAAGALDSNVNASLTVEIQAATAEQKDWADESARGNQAQEILRKIPGITRVTQVSNDSVAQLLRPWLGERANFESLPLPLLLDVQMDERNPPDKRAMQAALSAIPGAVIDDHGRFMQDLGSFTRAMRHVAFYVMVLGIVALLLSVFFAARSSFTINREMISLMHLMGAEDGAVAQYTGLFILRLLLLSVGLAAIGTLLTLIFLTATAPASLSGLFPHFRIGFMGWLALLGLWALLFGLTILLGMLTARFSVLRDLRRIH
jgi:cell division transport system permease protein